jgi:hypothetical protein
MLLDDRPEATRPQWRISGQKGWRGMWSPPDLGMGGGRGDQLMLQTGRRGEGLERWKSACWFWRAPKIMGARPHSERAPKNNGGRALILWEVW